ITIGGTVAGVVLSVLVPAIHGEEYVLLALKATLVGAMAGAGIVFAILELGKLLLGRQRFRLEPGSRVTFTETELHLAGRVFPYDEVFNRASDALVFHAARLELVDRCYWNTTVQLRLRAGELRIGDETVDPTHEAWMEALTDE